MSKNYDNWERLVGATLKREQLRALACADSIDSSVTSSSLQSYPHESEPSRFGSNDSSVVSNASIHSLCSGSSSCKSVCPQRLDDTILMSSQDVKAFLFDVLKNATRNFRPNSLLGEPRHGYVFKGWFDERTFAPARPGSGLPVTVKQLKPDVLLGPKDWLTRVKRLGQLDHPNLVKLLGYCSQGMNQLLVYEFMPKGISLDNHLFRRQEPLSWATRIKVAVGAAKGLVFLHDADQQVIHGDFQASNILLNPEFNVKLSNFGFLTGDRTQFSPQVMGTHGYGYGYGYAAPECAAKGRLTTKSDVYSFGVMLLELLSGRSATGNTNSWHKQDLVDWAIPYMGDMRKLIAIMDIKLESKYPRNGAYTAASIALQCLSHEPKHRPHMAEVLVMLEELQSQYA